MGIVEVVGYAGDGFINCTQCTREQYEEELLEPVCYVGSFRQWLVSRGLQAVTDQEEFGPEGYYCDCGNAIQESRCPRCGIIGGGGELCRNCKATDDPEAE